MFDNKYNGEIKYIKFSKGGLCLSKCKYFKHIGIGSMACKECCYNNGGEWRHDHPKPFVYCEAKKWLKGGNKCQAKDINADANAKESEDMKL